MQHKHIKWIEAEEEITLSGIQKVHIYNFNYADDDSIMNEWANYFREHYCLNEEIDILRDGTGLSREEYLLKRKFPDKTSDFGPATRSGDFAEILVADYLQYILKYYVPRTRYDRKTVRNESIKGCDVIGLLMKDENELSEEDSVLIFEVKATLSGKKKENRLQDAVNDSQKDPLRLSESLNAMKQRLLDRKDYLGISKVSRFQNKVEKPYTLNLGAAAILNNSVYDKDLLSKTDISMHNEQLNLIVIKGENMMSLVHELYRRASKC